VGFGFGSALKARHHRTKGLRQQHTLIEHRHTG
jgi:hypothetical protein